jgi:predicted transcriptional regulator
LPAWRSILIGEEAVLASNTATLTVSLPEDLNRALSAMVKRKGIGRSQIVQDALRRQLAPERFRDLRERLVPKRGEAGSHTDEDVFKAIS